MHPAMSTASPLHPVQTIPLVGFLGENSILLNADMDTSDWPVVAQLAKAMQAFWRDVRQVVVCSNGGSFGKAIHLVNDYLHGNAKRTGGYLVDLLIALPGSDDSANIVSSLERAK